MGLPQLVAIVVVFVLPVIALAYWTAEQEGLWRRERRT